MFKYLLILLLPISLFSYNDYNSLDLGIHLGSNYIQNETSLPIINGDTCCGKFSNGNAVGFYAGISLTYELLPSYLFIDGRFLFDSRPANLTANTNDYSVYNSTTDQYEQALVKNDFEATLNYFVFDIGLKVKPISSIPILFRLGIDFSDASISKSYSQSRQIIEPSGILINGKSTEIVDEDDFSNLAVSEGLSGAFIADIPLSNIITLSPEISYRYPLNSTLDNIDWFTTLIRAGAAISIKLNAPEKEIESKVDTVSYSPNIVEEKKEEPIIVEENILKNLSIEDLSITETVVTQTYPILPYVFFDSASSNLKSKYYYKGETNGFSEQKLDKNSIKIYERLLDIIGSRLKESNSNLLIKGYTDGREMDNITDRSTLAFKRASSIRDYLISKWNIPIDKLIIETQDTPTQPTSTQYNEGLEENRRVELLPSDINLLKPIIHSQFLEYASNQNKINVNIDADLSKIKDYTLIISDNKNQYYSESKLTSPTKNLLINVDNKFLNDVASSDLNNLKVELLVTKKDGRREDKTAKFNIIKEKNNFELGRLNLIVFDFDKSEISEPNKNMINRFIVNNISKNSETEIIGSTDFLGERNYNNELSQNRANNVAKYINTLLPDVKFKNVVGVGSENPKFDNSTPEGRFYCRTVLIEVKTPIK